MGWNGRLLPIGFTSGEIPSLAMNLPLLKNYSVVGVFVGAWMERYPEEAARASEKIMAWVGEGKLRPQVDRVLPLQQCRRGDGAGGEQERDGADRAAGQARGLTFTGSLQVRRRPGSKRALPPS